MTLEKRRASNYASLENQIHLPTRLICREMEAGNLNWLLHKNPGFFSPPLSEKAFMCFAAALSPNIMPVGFLKNSTQATHYVFMDPSSL